MLLHICAPSEVRGGHQMFSPLFLQPSLPMHCQDSFDILPTHAPQSFLGWAVGSKSNLSELLCPAERSHIPLPSVLFFLSSTNHWHLPWSPPHAGHSHPLASACSLAPSLPTESFPSLSFYKYNTVYKQRSSAILCSVHLRIYHPVAGESAPGSWPSNQGLFLFSTPSNFTDLSQVTSSLKLGRRDRVQIPSDLNVYSLMISISSQHTHGVLNSEASGREAHTRPAIW